VNAVTIFLSLLPGFAWLLFYLHEDLHPEPRRLILMTFIVGMAFAFFAIAAELFLNPLLQGIGIMKLSVISLLVLGFVEEFCKFNAAHLVVHHNPAFDEPVDAMIYMVVASLGFATLENIGAVGNLQNTQTALLSSVFQVASLRFVGATLLHSLTSALVGYFWAIGIRDIQPKRFLAIGLLIATVLHAAFNYLIINYGNVIYTVVFLAVIGFFVLSDFEALKRRAL